VPLRVDHKGRITTLKYAVLDSDCLGGVAQLGERRVRNAKVGSSILLLSTMEFFLKPATVAGFLFARLSRLTRASIVLRGHSCSVLRDVQRRHPLQRARRDDRGGLARPDKAELENLLDGQYENERLALHDTFPACLGAAFSTSSASSSSPLIRLTAPIPASSCIRCLKSPRQSIIKVDEVSF
jgi:hypothetical protein